MDGPADGGEDRRGFEGVVGHSAGEAQSAREGAFSDGHDLDVGHLVLGNGEEFGGFGLRFGGRERSHLGFRFARTAPQPERDEMQKRTVAKPRQEAQCMTLLNSNASWQIPRSHGLAHLFEREHVTGKRLAVGKLVGTVGSLRIEKIEQAGGAFVVGVFADVAGLLGLVDVAAPIQLNDLIVGAKIFVSLDDVGGNLLGGFAGLLLGLGDGVAGARDFALVAVENGEGHVEVKCAGVDAGGVGVIESAGEVVLAVGFLQGQLALRGGHALAVRREDRAG